MYRHHFEVNVTSLKCRVRVYAVASKINTTDQTVHVYACWEFITLHFQALYKLKIGTSLCDVTVTLKRQRKIVKTFFFFLNRIHFSTRTCMFDTFTKKCTRNYTAANTVFILFVLILYRKTCRMANRLRIKYIIAFSMYMVIHVNIKE